MSTKRIDMTGQVFGRLTVKSPLPRAKWLCECSCTPGKLVAVCRHHLISGKTQSCGCLRVERASSMAAEREQGQKSNKEMHVDGTFLGAIKETRKINSNSSTGVRGVSRMKNGRYRAHIVFKRKQINLGTHATLAEAKEAREKAERRIFGEFLEQHERLKVETEFGGICEMESQETTQKVGELDAAAVVAAYETYETLRQTARFLGISEAKARKLLITAGAYKTRLSAKIEELLAAGLTTAEIGEKLNMKSNVVNSYTPYVKAVYGGENRTENAKRIEKSRQKPQAAES